MNKKFLAIKLERLWFYCH